MYKITVFITLVASTSSTSLETITNENTNDNFSEYDSITYPITIMTEISKGTKLKDFEEYSNDLKKKGAVMLKNLNELIVKGNGLSEDVNLNVTSAIKSYENNIQNFYDFVAELDRAYNFEKVYMFMNLLDTSCKLIYIEQKTFLEKIEKKSAVDLYPNVVIMVHQEIFDETINIKKKELLYVCKNYGICTVPYSVFTHYFEYFMDEVLLLPETEIGLIIQLLSDLVTSNNHFLRLIKSDKETVLLVKNLFANTYKMKLLLVALRNLIKKRHILFRATDLKHEIRIQAVRALFESIEKAYYFKHGNIYNFDIYATITAVRNWGAEKENFRIDKDKTELDICKSAIRQFLTFIFKGINYKNKDINRYLIKTIITGTLENGTYENLFQNGYKGVYTII